MKYVIGVSAFLAAVVITIGSMLAFRQYRLASLREACYQESQAKVELKSCSQLFDLGGLLEVSRAVSGN